MHPVPFGRYVLVDKLALGGMAELFLAKAQGDGGFSKTCVIKRVLPHLADDARFVQMFLDEARLAASLNHPGIVQIFDLGQEGGDYFLAMEYLPGEDLHACQEALGERGRKMEIPLAVWVIEQAAAALHHAHERTGEDGRSLRIVHRDVSPSNLLLTYDGTLKLLDFGIARAESRLVKTQPEAMKGKAGYTSPEQAQGKGVDRRTDVWALGVCLHELLTGERLFPGESIVESALASLNKVIPPPSTRRAGIPPALDAIVLAALERDPARRTASAEALRAALAKARADDERLRLQASPGEFLVGLFGEARAAERRNRGAVQLSSAAIPRTDALAGAGAARPSAGPPGTEALRTFTGGAATVPSAASLRRRRGSLLAVAALSAALAAAGVWAVRARWPVLGHAPTPEPGVPVSTGDGARETPSAAVAEKTAKAPASADAESAEATGGASTGATGERGDTPQAEATAKLPSQDATGRPLAGTAKSPYAFVTVTSNAPVDVWNGRTRLGSTPLTRARVKAGTVSLRLSNARLGLSRTLKLELRRGAELSREVVFRKGELSVNVAPWADVWLDGEKLGQTPLAAREVWEGKHRLKLSSPLGTKELQVEVAPGRTVTVQERLP